MAVRPHAMRNDRPGRGVTELVILWPRVQVGIERAKLLLGDLIPYFIALHIAVVPDWMAARRRFRMSLHLVGDVAVLDAVERLSDRKQTLNDSLHGEVLLHFFAIDRVFF